MSYELLFKTNPNKPNLVRRSIGEGGFKRRGFRIWLNGIDSVELAEQRGLQTNLTGRSKTRLRNVTPPEISGCANPGLGGGIWHDICSHYKNRQKEVKSA